MWSSISKGALKAALVAAYPMLKDAAIELVREWAQMAKDKEFSAEYKAWEPLVDRLADDILAVLPAKATPAPKL